MKTVRVLGVLLFMLLFYSCATLIHGRYQRVNVSSEPSGAKVYINGEDTKLTTPCNVLIRRKQPETSINRKNEIVYVLKKEDYLDVEYRDMSKFNWLAGVDFIYYVVPGLVDVANGSSRVYSKDVYVKLNQANQVVVKTDTIVKKELVYVNTGKASAYVFEKKSDVDISIPEIGIIESNRFALIIGNEDYCSRQIDLNSEINVDFARNDASAFKEYAIKILGIPERNIIFMIDATTGQMNQGISKLNLIIKNTQGNADVFVYYAGHGLPDEQTKEPYIMPVDVSGKNAADGIKLKDMYTKLLEFPSKRVTVFIDACFSGGARNQGLLAARGVKVKPKEDPLKGNLVVFSASSGEQSSLSYKERNHGFFTYFLLKKLKESKGNLSYSELASYIKDNVSLQSVLIIDKEQSPQVSISNTINDVWSNYRIR